MKAMLDPSPARRRGRPASEDGVREPQGGVRALDRALGLLQAVAGRPQGATLSDLAEDAGLAPSTTHRLLRGLEDRRFVAQDTERGLWFVGVGAFRVGTAFLRGRDVVQLARPVMRRLMEEAAESVNLAVRDGDRAIYLSQVECRQMMRALAAPGGRAPLHASAVGKALLMGLKSHEMTDVLAGLTLDRHTALTLCTPEALEADLAAARARGYAIDDEEHAVGLRCVAAPIRNEYGETVAAISLSGPVARIDDDRLARLGRMIGAAAADISREYGAG